jgi:hypothetical protein
LEAATGFEPVISNRLARALAVVVRVGAV